MLTIHNFSDALTAVPLFIAFRLSRRPPIRRYTYGFRRAEDLAGVFVIAMITLSSLIAAHEAVRRLINPQPLEKRRLAICRRCSRLRRQRAGGAVSAQDRAAHRLRGARG